MAVARLVKVNANNRYEVYDKTLDDIQALKLIALGGGITSGGNIDASPDGGTTKFKLINLATPTNDNDGTTKKYVDDLFLNLNWLKPVPKGIEYIGTRTITEINALSPSTGWTVVVGSAGTPSAGTSDALAIGDVAEFDGTSWKKIVTNSGGFVPAGTRLIVHEGVLYSPLTDATDENKIADFDGTTNTPTLITPVDSAVGVVGNDLSVNDTKGYIYDTASTDWLDFPNVTNLVGRDGIAISGSNVDVDLDGSDSGLEFTGTQPNRTLGLAWATTYAETGKAVRAGDLNDSTTAGKGAEIIGFRDPDSVWVGTNVYDVVNEGKFRTLTTNLAVSKGDLLYYSGADAVDKLPISSGSGNEYSVGIAVHGAGSASPVKVLLNDQILTGVGTGWTAGDPVFWNGTALTQTIPSGAGQYVWVAGIAKNATDLDVNVEFSHRNELN